MRPWGGHPTVKAAGLWVDEFGVRRSQQQFFRGHSSVRAGKQSSARGEHSHVDAADSPRALDSATPQKLWIYAVLIALVGVVLRWWWYVEFQDGVVAFDFGRADWAFWEQSVGQADAGPYAAGELLTPVAGDSMRLVSELTSRAQVIEVWAWIQNAMIAVTTLATFAISRRVLFGWVALVPALLLTLNPPLAELASWPSEYVLLMSFMAWAVLLLCIAQEQAAREAADRRIALLVVVAGLLIGLAVLTHLAAWLFLLPVLWWAFRGIDRSWGVVLVLAALLLPAIQLGVMTGSDAQKRDDVRVLVERGLGYGDVPADATALSERVTGLADPSPQPFLRPSFEDFRPVGWVLLSLVLLFALFGVWALWQEGPGSVARLIVLPLLVLLGIFFESEAFDLRAGVLPSLLVAAVVGASLLAEQRVSARN